MLSLSAKQKIGIKNSTRRLNIFEGAVRSAKTWGSLFRWITLIGRSTSKEANLIIGRTERSAVRNIVRPLQRLVGDDNCLYYPGKAELWLFDKCCYILGSNDERAEGKIRGLTVQHALGDEMTLWSESFFTMLLSRLSEPESKLIGTTNPDNPYHYLKLNYLDRSNELDMFIQHYELDDNPFISDDFKNNLKKEYRGLWYKRFILGLWCMAEGAVYDMFEEDEHVITKFPKSKYKVVGIDYGTGNPTTFLLYGINLNASPKIWLEKEYYYSSQITGRQKDDNEYKEDLVKFIGNENVTTIIPDPSALSFITCVRKLGKFIIRNADNDVINGIRTQARMLTTGQYKIYEGCKHTITDYGAYLWDAKAAKRGEDKPLKQNDHTKDAERYVLHTLFGSDAIEYENFVKG
jgi:PBSX family phage terminase large subunit